MTLTEFLLARIAEDEAIAVTVKAKANRGDGAAWIVTGMDNWTADYDPARVLAECEAKRRIVERLNHLPWVGSRAVRDVLLGDLAVPYADHPDYRQEWRP